MSEIVYELERLRDGANVHTLNTAIYWLEHLSRPVKRFTEAARLDILSKYAASCEAVVSGKAEWNTLYRSVNKLIQERRLAGTLYQEESDEALRVL